MDALSLTSAQTSASSTSVSPAPRVPEVLPTTTETPADLIDTPAPVAERVPMPQFQGEPEEQPGTIASFLPEAMVESLEADLNDAQRFYGMGTRLLRDRLISPETASSDENIQAVLLLIAYASDTGSMNEVPIHSNQRDFTMTRYGIQTAGPRLDACSSAQRPLTPEERRAESHGYSSSSSEGFPTPSSPSSLGDDSISALSDFHHIWETQAEMDTNVEADMTRARNDASRREASNKHNRMVELVQEQGSRHLHQNEINLYSCRFFDIDSQDNVTFFIDPNGNKFTLEEVNFLDTKGARDDDWCRIGERFYRRTVDLAYRERGRQWLRETNEQQLQRAEWVAGIALVALVAVSWFA
ncbi:hypothetical protein PMZ80_004339 [Knufia obscura]|uniref:Uncharacterized protein n=1 Tax=Knufia obscura TaxID=1635080 RepID=A0ABR0RRT6_9EURO|nr:hypothetical protein PMZ80_004339 [Knufia obscura]